MVEGFTISTWCGCVFLQAPCSTNAHYTVMMTDELLWASDVCTIQPTRQYFIILMADCEFLLINMSVVVFMCYVICIKTF